MNKPEYPVLYYLTFYVLYPAVALIWVAGCVYLWMETR